MRRQGLPCRICWLGLGERDQAGLLFNRLVREGKVIYVGKAIVLRNRVRSYFHSSAQHTPKTLALVEEIRIVKHALAFGEKSVHDVMTPRSVITSVREDDVLSPALLDELDRRAELSQRF